MSQDNPHKAEMIKWLNHQILKMDQYCKLNQINNKMIAEKCGLGANNVWRFRNRTSPEMSMVNFLLISKAIGYEIEFKKFKN